MLALLPLLGCSSPAAVPPEQPGTPPAATATTWRQDGPAAPRGQWGDEPPETIPEAWVAHARPELLACPDATAVVTGSAQLEDALESAAPGDVIRLEPGTYQPVKLTTSGSTDRPIWLCGSADSVIDGGGIKGGYGVHLENASWVNVVGLTVTNAQKGIMVDAGSHVRLQENAVKHVGDEAIHLRRGTVDSIVQANTIEGTGLRNPKFGEGVYIGTAESNWPDLTGGSPDASDRNLILGNTIRGTTAEAVDIKEGTTGGVLAENTFDGAGMTAKGADSWVDVKGNDWLVVNNRGVNSLGDGFQTHEILDGWGDHNIFAGNSAAGIGRAPEKSLPAGIALRPALANVATCTNIAEGFEIANVDCVQLTKR